MNSRLLEIIACPICQGRLDYDKNDGTERLICKFDKVFYSVENGIPVLLAEQAKPLTSAEQES